MEEVEEEVEDVEEDEALLKEIEFEEKERKANGPYTLIIIITNGESRFHLTYQDGREEDLVTEKLNKAFPKNEAVKIKISKVGFSTRYIHFPANKDKISEITLSPSAFHPDSETKSGGGGEFNFIGMFIIFIILAVAVFVFLSFLTNLFRL